MKTNNKGFSLVELIVVIAIMAILAAVAIPTFATFINKANVASDVSFINDLEYAAQLAHTATGDTVANLTVTVDADGNVKAVAYKVLDKDKDNAHLASITIAQDEQKNNKWTAEVAQNENDDFADDAQTAVDTIDWTYKFKSTKKAGTWEFNTTKNDWEFKPTTTT